MFSKATSHVYLTYTIKPKKAQKQCNSSSRAMVHTISKNCQCNKLASGHKTAEDCIEMYSGKLHFLVLSWQTLCAIAETKCKKKKSLLWNRCRDNGGLSLSGLLQPQITQKSSQILHFWIVARSSFAKETHLPASSLDSKVLQTSKGWVFKRALEGEKVTAISSATNSQ